MTEQELIEQFHLMWDSTPGLVRLIDKEKRVLAVNRYGMALGYPVGVRCCDALPRQSHSGCKGALALSAGQSQLDSEREGLIRFWLPVTDSVYVHFSISQTDRKWDFKKTAYQNLL